MLPETLSMKMPLSGNWRPQPLLAWLDRLPPSAAISAGIALGCGLGGAGFHYLEAPGWALAWLALFAALGWLGYTATPVFDEPDPVRAAVKPSKPRPVRDGSLLMVDLPGGRFLIGSPDSDDLAHDDEKPQHEVTVSLFRIAITPVTAELYREIMPESASIGREADGRLPVMNATWFIAVEFCNRLSERASYQPCYSKRFGRWRCDWRADGYRLPTEAEREYAFWADTATRYSFGDDPAGLDGYAVQVVQPPRVREFLLHIRSLETGVIDKAGITAKLAFIVPERPTGASTATSGVFPLRLGGYIAADPLAKRADLLQSCVRNRLVIALLMV